MLHNALVSQIIRRRTVLATVAFLPLLVLRFIIIGVDQSSGGSSEALDNWNPTHQLAALAECGSIPVRHRLKSLGATYPDSFGILVHLRINRGSRI